MKTRIILVALLCGVFPMDAANPPGILNHQGRIAVNQVNHDGTGHFKFAMVNAGGTATYWSNDGTSAAGAEPAAAVAVPVAMGHYAVLLGDVSLANMTSPVPAGVFTDHDSVFLRIWFSTSGAGPFELLSPDRRITAAGYALASQRAEGVAPGGVTGAMLANGAVTSAKIADGAVTASDLALGTAGFVRKPVLLAEVGGEAESGPVFTPMSLQLDPAGSLDPGFGAGGKVITNVGVEEFIDGVAIQDDGKPVVAGHAVNDGKGFLVGRYLENGTPDPAFGTGGFVSLGAPSFMADTGVFHDVVMLEDGGIIAGGVVEARQFSLAKLNPDGSLDTSFGTNGMVFPRAGTGSFDQTGNATGVHSILMEGGGSMVLAGGAVDLTYPQYDWGPEAFAVVRCNPDGSVAGRNLARPAEDLVTPAWAKAGVLQPDGKIVMAGHTAADEYSPGNFALLRFNADLSIDSSFGTGGWVITDMGGNDVVAGVVLMPDGRIFVAGTTGGDLAFARYETTGALDATFGTGGKLTVDVGDAVNLGAVRIDGSGRILVTGSRGGDMYLARLNSDGVLDASFGSGGMVATDFGSDSDLGRCLTTDQDGRIVVGGSTISQTYPMTERMALARYLGDAPWNGSTASVWVAGNIAYMVSSGPDGGNLTVIDIGDPASPVILTEQSTPHPILNLDGVRDITVQGTTAFMVSRESGCLDIVDLSVPDSPVLLASLGDGGGGFNQLGGAWSVAVSGSTAFVAALGDNALTIMDVSDPASPVGLAELVDGIGGFNRLAGARDVFVDGDTAYVTATNDNALSIIDVSQPAAPLLIAELVDGAGGFTRLAGAREVFVRDGIAYVTADGDDALTLIDVSNPAAPVLLAEVTDGSGGFNRLDGAAGVFVSGTVAMVTAELDDAVTMIDVSDPAHPLMLEETVDENGGFTKLNGADGVFVHGTVAFVASNGDDALTLIDLASPSAPYAGTVTNGLLAPDAVTSDKIRDGSIVAEDINDGAVTSDKIADGSVSGSKLADGGVETDALATGAVTGDKLAEGAVSAAALVDGVVSEQKLADGSVTTPKLADGAVTAGKIAEAAVETAALADDAVTASKIADGAVGGGALAAGAVTSNKIASGSVTLDKLALGGNSGQILFNTGTATEWRDPAAVLGDESSTNEIQTLSRDGNTLSLSAGGGSVNLGDGDADPENELQTLALDGDSLSLVPASGTAVDLSQYLRRDGSAAFAGDLDMAGYKITGIQSLAPVSGGTSPLTVDGDLNLNSNQLRNVRKLAIGVGDAAASLHVATSDTTPQVSLFEHTIGTLPGELVDMARLRAVFSGTMTEGFGPAVLFEIRDNVGANLPIGRIGVGRGGADGSMVFQTSNGTNGMSAKMTIRSDGHVDMRGNLYVGSISGNADDTVYFDYGGNEYLRWRDAQGRFEFSDDVSATSFNPTSDRNLKGDFGEVNPMEVLDRISTMPVSTWKFKGDGTGARHMGPMAQDFHGAFGLGGDDRHISTTDADGVAFAAIQALKQLLDEKERRIAELERRLETLERKSGRGSPRE